MIALMQELLSVLESDGFCYHSLHRIARECDGRLAKRGETDRSIDIVRTFVIGRACFEVAQKLDIGPVTTAAHDRIANAVRPVLEAAIRTLGSAESEQSMAKLDALISAINSRP